VRAGAGDIDGDGFSEILTAPGPGIIFGPHIRGFDADGGKAKAKGKVTFFACGAGRYGASVAASDVESDGIGGYGDGYAEIRGGGGGQGRHVSTTSTTKPSPSSTRWSPSPRSMG